MNGLPLSDRVCSVPLPQSGQVCPGVPLAAFELVVFELVDVDARPPADTWFAAADRSPGLPSTSGCVCLHAGKPEQPQNGPFGDVRIRIGLPHKAHG